MSHRRNQPSSVLWRRKWWLAAWVLLFTSGAFFLARMQPKQYDATATIAVGQSTRTGATFDVVQADQAYARTLARLVGSPNVADRVLPELSFRLSRQDALSAMSFQQLPETQLLTITAEDRSPARAAELANTWARVFTDYVDSSLKEIAPSTVTVADAAVEPDRPAKPRPTLTALVALLLSVAIGVTAALVQARLDRKIGDVEVLTEVFGLPVLGMLPTRGRSRMSAEQFSEAIRLLRANLQFVTDVPLRSVSVTSARPGEGKTTVAAELARSFALLSLVPNAVLAVDADMRRPALLDRLGIDGEATRPGLTDVLRGTKTVDAVAVETSLVSLRAIGTGEVPSNPSALLGFAASRDAMVRTCESAPVVVWDTPPTGVGADAALVASVVDGVLVAVDLRSARLDDLQRVVEQLGRVQANVLGFVVNRAPMDRRAAVYYGTPRGSTRRTELEEIAGESSAR